MIINDYLDYQILFRRKSNKNYHSDLTIDKKIIYIVIN